MKEIFYTNIASSSGYYPFGMLKPGRNGCDGSGYTYGFNGMGKDDEIKGEGLLNYSESEAGMSLASTAESSHSSFQVWKLVQIEIKRLANSQGGINMIAPELDVMLLFGTGGLSGAYNYSLDRMATSLVWNGAKTSTSQFASRTFLYNQFATAGGRSFYGVRNFTRNATKTLSFGKGEVAPMPMWNALNGGTGPMIQNVIKNPYVGVGAAGVGGGVYIYGTYKHAKTKEGQP